MSVSFVLREQRRDERALTTIIVGIPPRVSRIRENAKGSWVKCSDTRDALRRSQDATAANGEVIAALQLLYFRDIDFVEILKKKTKKKNVREVSG